MEFQVVYALVFAKHIIDVAQSYGYVVDDCKRSFSSKLSDVDIVAVTDA